MNRYRVNRMWIEKKTGEVLLEDQFSFDDNLIAGLHPLSCEITAIAYMRKAATDWLMEALGRWIKHKENIYSNLSGNPPQLEAVNKVKAACAQYHDKKLSAICANILKGQGFFEACLPSKNNPSYASSLKNLNEILEFCKETKDTNYANA